MRDCGFFLTCRHLARAIGACRGRIAWWPHPGMLGVTAAMDTAADNPKELAEQFDLTALPPGFYADPYPFYRALRQHAPVKRLPDGGVFLTRYGDVVAVYKDAGTFSSDKKREFGPKFGDTPALCPPHHQPRLQRPAAAYARQATALRRAHAARHSRHGRPADGARRSPARSHGRKAGRRPDRGFRSRHPGRDHRQPARCAA